jgi:hypothetical protein
MFENGLEVKNFTKTLASDEGTHRQKVAIPTPVLKNHQGSSRGLRCCDELRALVNIRHKWLINYDSGTNV